MNTHIVYPVRQVFSELVSYVSNIKNFKFEDWFRYCLWIGTVGSLFFATSTFVYFGYTHGVNWPGYVWMIPIGTGMFTFALAIDDIGHRTMYKEHLKKGEGYVHHMIVVSAVGSVMALCLCYEHSETFRMAALGLIFLSLFYSAIDELLHWQRYLTHKMDRIEMWSHFVAICGHVLMISCWWQWFVSGYPGVAETLEHFR